MNSILPDEDPLYQSDESYIVERETKLSQGGTALTISICALFFLLGAAIYYMSNNIDSPIPMDISERVRSNTVSHSPDNAIIKGFAKSN